jgi:hypothetical protein
MFNISISLYKKKSFIIVSIPNPLILAFTKLSKRQNKRIGNRNNYK